MVILTEEQLNEAQQSGLYLPELEKDGCGVGFVVSVQGIATHQVLFNAVFAEKCLNFL